MERARERCWSWEGVNESFFFALSFFFGWYLLPLCFFEELNACGDGSGVSVIKSSAGIWAGVNILMREYLA